jgi:hypothetical protein
VEVLMATEFDSVEDMCRLGMSSLVLAAWHKGETELLLTLFDATTPDGTKLCTWDFVIKKRPEDASE